MEEKYNDEIENSKVDEKNDISYLRKQWIYKSIIVVVFIGCIIGIASSSITYYFTLENKNKKFVASTYKVENETTTASGAIDDLTDVLESFAEIVDEQYIGEIDKSKLVNETVKGFINGLGDEYSEYMTAEEWTQYQEDALGNYSVVGIVMMQDDNGYILVTNVIKDGPAEKAGIKQGDYIVGVNGESIYNVDSSEVSKKVKGEDDIGYIYFNTFDDGCADEFEQEMDKLVEQGAKKIVLDLRYNTGGAVDQALQILDLFLEKGQIELKTKSANGLEVTTSSKTDKKYSFDNMVILINEYTASASEILTGALIDNDLAKTVGTKSYGKGVMQSVLQLLDGSVLKITTQEYNTPKGTKIHEIGITPDYEIEYENDESGESDNQLEKAKAVLKGEE